MAGCGLNQPAQIGIPVVCGSVKRLWCVPSRLVRAVGPECGRDEVGVDLSGDAVGGILVGQGSERRSPIGWRVTVNLASVLVSVEVVAARWSGAWAYLRHAPRLGVSMKPYGHDHRELTHVARPHQWWVMPMLRAARWPWPDLMRRRRGSGSRRRAVRRTPR
jgi:hypothetical protein